VTHSRKEVISLTLETNEIAVGACYREIEGNENADQLAKTGSECPFIGFELACGISVGVVKRAIKDWMKRDCGKHWESTRGLRHMNGFLQGPCAKRTRELVTIKWEPTEMGDRTTYRTLSPKWTHFQIGTSSEPHL
jgi:hypothetical protein